MNTLDLSADYKGCSQVQVRRIEMKARTAKSSLKLMLLSLSAVVVVVLPAVLAPSAFTQQGGPYALNQSVIAGGGGVSANGNTNVSGTIGQGVLGSSNGGSFSLN